MLEQLRSEKAALEDENRRVLAQVFSEEEASELSVARQQLIQRDGEIKRLKSRIREADEKAKITAEAHAAAGSRLAAAHGERDSAKRALHRAQSELAQRKQEVEALERRVAHLVGDTGVPPEDIERALAMLRDTQHGAVGGARLGLRAGESAAGSLSDVGFGEASARLQDTDLSKLGLPPLAKRQVHEILIQNNELSMQLDKTESLLKISQRLADTLRAELDATKRREAKERARLQKQLALRTQELTSATRNALRHSEMIAALEAQRKDYIAGRAPRAPALPHAHDLESVAGSVISEGTHSELDVGPDENMFELRVASASLHADYFGALPSTFVSVDFFQHDTQATPMRQGLQPEFDFTAQYVLSVDDSFLHYLATASLRIELNQSWGVECQVSGHSPWEATGGASGRTPYPIPTPLSSPDLPYSLIPRSGGGSVRHAAPRVASVAARQGVQVRTAHVCLATDARRRAASRAPDGGLARIRDVHASEDRRGSLCFHAAVPRRCITRPYTGAPWLSRQGGGDHRAAGHSAPAARAQAARRALRPL